MPSRHNLLWLKCGPLLAINKCNQRGRYDRTKSNQSNPFKLRASSSPPPHAHAHPLARWVTLAPAAAKPPRVFVRAPTMRAADSRAYCTVLYCPSVAHCSRGQAMFLTSTTVNRCFWHGQPTNNVFVINIKQTMFLTLVVVEICLLHRCTTKWCFWLEVFINRYPRWSSATSHRSEDESVFGCMTLSCTYSGDLSCVNLYCRFYTFF